MHSALLRSLLCSAALCLVAIFATSRASGHGFPDGSFEGRNTHSIALSADGSRLFVADTAEGRLCVFRIGAVEHPAPVLEMEIPVGIDPVAVRPRTEDEVWVVNEVSDSVSIVSLRRRVVIATLQVPDEPADVVFVQGKAFISAARNAKLWVFDAASRAPLGTVPLHGNFPRAMAVDAAGEKLYVAFLLSGNRTTVLKRSLAPAPPLPTNPALPAAPQTALIVPASDSRIPYTVLDHDVAEVDIATQQVTRILSDVGTHLFDLAVRPGSGELWAANSESRNLVRFEPALRGHVVDHRLTRIQLSSGENAVHDLNPGVDYALLPNPAAKATALAQPTALLFKNDGTEAWVAAFNSDRLARINAATGEVSARLDLRRAGETSSRQMRGPRAMAWNQTLQRLYVLNLISGTVAVIDTAVGSVLAEVPLASHRPGDADFRAGRGFLFDARISGNGTVSCASCHLDADTDGLAWDLGDPNGVMTTVMGANLSVHDPTPRPRTMHPMKGPMMTQTLRAMFDGAPFHWRGDRATLQTFNATFDELMAGPRLAAADINALASYLSILMPHPNPYRRLDDSLPATLNGANPARGEALFNMHTHHCAECHGHHAGATNNIDLHQEVGSTQPIKNPPLRTVYQRLSYNPRPGAASLSGFGMLHDGTGFVLPTVHDYALDELSEPSEFADLAAFILCADSGITPDCGVSRTFTTLNLTDAEALATVTIMESRSSMGFTELVMKGRIAGQPVSYYHNASYGRYDPDDQGAPRYNLAELLARLQPEDAITFIGMPYGRGYRMGYDRDFDGIYDADEAQPKLNIQRTAPAAIQLAWPHSIPGWVLESSPQPDADWQPVTRPPATSGAMFQHNQATDLPRLFFRLRRTW